MPSIQQSNNKVSRHRERMRAAGLRPVQFWVPDTREPEFIAQVQSQCQILKGDPAEADLLRFTEQAAREDEGGGQGVAAGHWTCLTLLSKWQLVPARTH